jgi:predicted nucleotidyltransferase
MPTALELSREGWKRYLEVASHHSELREATVEERRQREQIISRIREAAELLKTRFGVRRVVLIGSLAHTAWFASDSDVDIAVEGLASGDYWDAWRLVEDTIADRPVDFIEIEMAGESLQRAIQRYGIEL